MSTDEKPTNCAVNSLFLELDTGIFYYFDGVWKKVGERATLGSSDDTDDTGTIQITENDVYDVTDYDYADVNVPGVVPVGTLPILENGTADVTSYATAEVDVDYATVNFNLPVNLERTTPTELSQARNDLAATTIGDYALFGGGHYGPSSNVVDAYDTSLIRSTPTALSQARYSLAATSVAPAGGSSPQSGYALFGGGYYDYVYSAVVDAYNTSLTRTTPTALSQARVSLAATSVGNYALFGGGSSSNVVDAYDQNLTRSTPTELSQARGILAATTVGDYALFGGGYGNDYSAIVDAYDQNLTRSTPTALSQARNYLATTSVGDYALFGGGSSSNVVDAYDTSLTRTTPTELSQARSSLAATSVAPAGGSSPQSGYALFGGGYYGGYLAVVDAYDQNLTRSTPTELSRARRYLAATTTGNYALFGGGYYGSRSNVVDAYSLASYDIQVFPDTKYSFNGSAEFMSTNMQTITIEGPVVGYIKIKNTNVTGD